MTNSTSKFVKPSNWKIFGNLGGRGLNRECAYSQFALNGKAYKSRGFKGEGINRALTVPTKEVPRSV